MQTSLLSFENLCFIERETIAKEHIAYAGPKALTYVTAKNHGPEEEASNIAEDLKRLPALSPNAQLLHSPKPNLTYGQLGSFDGQQRILRIYCCTYVSR